MRIGIDFGTTNSAVAYYDGATLYPVDIDPGNDNPRVLPSLIYIQRNHETSLGSAAAAEYLEQETGRRPVWERQHMGAIEIIVAGSGSAPIQYLHDIYEQVDIAAKGRLLQSVKTVLRDPQYEGTRIFDRYYPVDELIAILLRAMRERAEQQLGGTCDAVVFGRPVTFSDDPAVSERAEELLYKVARFAGFKEITFQLEPIGAAHLYHRSAMRRELALLFDFGGGTLDLTVVEVGGREPPRVLATRGVLVGGDDLDRRVMESLLTYFGAGSKVEGDVDFPYYMLDLLKAWQTMPELSRPQELGKIRRFQETSNNPEAMRALETLVTANVGFSLFKTIERAKIQLSTDLIAKLEFSYQAIQIRERILRRRFEELLEQEVALVERELHAVLAEAGVRPEQVQVVLRTGGSSQIPIFVALLERIFGYEKLRAMDPLTSVVGGMAVVAQEDAGRRPGAYAARYVSPITGAQVASSHRYRQTFLRSFRPAYTDQPYPIMRLPLTLSGLPAIQTADLDYGVRRDSFLHFYLERPAKVYVAYLGLARGIPDWLQTFTPEPMSLEIDHPGGRMPFVVYSRDFPAGKVTLGGNQAPGSVGPAFMNYLVAARPLE
ncbi:MAG TPA: Hsp70 family protein [Anaerolineae bacterium]|nr:Hsp70 family protein [Anaerolineae bacterium]